MQNHFELFHLPQQFDVDMKALDQAYREVQNQVHPDKFASSPDAEKRVAMQWATRANEAYQTLKSPLRRATYLCELNGVDLQAESNTAMAPAFLMQQMEWREALDDAKAAKDAAALDRLEGEVRRERNAELDGIGKALDEGRFEDAGKGVRQLMFLEKFTDEIAHAFEAMEA
ncbi:MAG TPA: Fe-S protein assembly co-chaperone HscB [Noviherbaspirillum sp.]